MRILYNGTYLIAPNKNYSHSKTLEYNSTAHLRKQASPSYLTKREVRPRNRSVLLVGSRLHRLPPHSTPGLRPPPPPPERRQWSPVSSSSSSRRHTLLFTASPTPAPDSIDTRENFFPPFSSAKKATVQGFQRCLLCRSLILFLEIIF